MTTTPITARAPLTRDWHQFHLPVHWSRYALRPDGTPRPTFPNLPIDLSVPGCVPDGQYPVANGNARSVDHLATVEDRLLDLAATAHACYEAIWRAHGLVPELPCQNSESDPWHLFVEEVEFDHHENVIRIWCGS